MLSQTLKLSFALFFLVLLFIPSSAAFAEEVTIFGTIQDSDGNVPEQESFALDLINGTNGSRSSGLYSEDDGSWSTDIEEGIYTIAIRSGWNDNSNWVSGYWDGARYPWETSWHLLIGEGREGPFDIVLEPGGTVTGTITDPEGNPVDYFVYAELIDGRQTMRNFKFSNCTDENGRYIMRGVPPGEYKLMAEYFFEEDSG